MITVNWVILWLGIRMKMINSERIRPVIYIKIYKVRDEGLKFFVCLQMCKGSGSRTEVCKHLEPDLDPNYYSSDPRSATRLIFKQ